MSDPANTYVTSHFSFGEPCELMDGRRVRMSEIFNVHSGLDFRPLFHHADMPPAFAEDFLARGGQPKLGGYEMLSCIECAQCIPVRVRVQEFEVHHEHKRVLGRNADLTMTTVEGVPDLGRFGNPQINLLMTKHSALYRRYMVSRFFNGKARRFSALDAIISLHGACTFPGMEPMHIDARTRRGRLVGSVLFHVAGQSAYGTVFFHDPERRTTSLGQALMLATLAHLKARGTQYYYLAHWTRHASAYSWKDKFTPLDALIDGTWQPVPDKATVRRLRSEGPAYPALRKPSSEPRQP